MTESAERTDRVCLVMGLVLGEKIAIFGCGGSGKSTLARQLGAVTGLPVIHLDQEYWQPGWTEPPHDEWVETMSRLISGKAWIIDGNYSGTGFEERLAAADTLIFLDISRYVCIFSVIQRWLSNLGRTRPDMAPGCPEKIDLEFLQWIWSFPRRSRPKIIAALAHYGDADGTGVFVLRTRKQIRGFIQKTEEN